MTVLDLIASMTAATMLVGCGQSPIRPYIEGQIKTVTDTDYYYRPDNEWVKITHMGEVEGGLSYTSPQKVTVSIAAYHESNPDYGGWSTGDKGMNGFKFKVRKEF